MKKQLLFLAFTILNACSYAQTTYESFNGGNKIAKIISKTGIKDLNSIRVVNPKKGKLNKSDSCGIYIRSSNAQYDNLKLSTGKLVNVTPYIEGKKKLTMLLYSASPGTIIELFLQDSTAAEGDYPRGRHSMFRATTSEENKWELLKFEFVFQADETVLPTNIDQILLQVAPNTKDSGTYYFDNLTGPDPIK